jgi:hypothetical protein
MRRRVGKINTVLMSLMLLCCFLLQQPVNASPFGQGVFSADVPFGSETSMSIALGGNVSIALAPSGPNFSGTGSHTLTVTTTDVVGYRLYVFSPTGTTMTNGGDTIPTSANGIPSSLGMNTWGYNTDGSSNFVGMLTTPKMIKDANGPYKTGDNTTVTYGALADITKGAGEYSVGVVYTAVAK